MGLAVGLPSFEVLSMSASSTSDKEPRSAEVPRGPQAITVDWSPLAHGPATIAPSVFRIKQPRPALLTLEPITFGISSLLVGVLLLGMLGTGMAQFDPKYRGPALVAPVLLLLFGLIRRFRSSPSSVQFDREAGILLFGSQNRRQQRSLKNVCAVQLIETLERTALMPETGEGMNATIHQLILVLDDPAQARMHLADVKHAESARQTARKIAEFLGVPSLDRYASPAITAPALAATENDVSYLMPGSATVPHVVLTELRPGCVELRPSWLGWIRENKHVRVALGTFAVLTGALVGLIAWLASGEFGHETLGYFLILPAFLIEGLLAFFLVWRLPLARVRFDRQTGRMTLGRFGLLGSRPLADVLAVQLVERSEIQVNLVLTDPRQPRLNLLTSQQQEATRPLARRLAAFLNVPLQGGVILPLSKPAEGQPLALDPSPLPVGKTTLTSEPTLVARGDHCLLLKTRRLARWFSRRQLFKGPGIFLLVLAVMGMGFGILLIYSAFHSGFLGTLWAAAEDEVRKEGGGKLVKGLFGVLLVAGWIFRGLFLDRIRFDRVSGWMTVGCFGIRGKRRLADILAVQLVKAGVQRDPGSENPTLTYQINLALRDSNEPRRNLTLHTDRTWSREAGQRIAGFLQVPLVDQIGDDAGSCTDSLDRGHSGLVGRVSRMTELQRRGRRDLLFLPALMLVFCLGGSISLVWQARHDWLKLASTSAQCVAVLAIAVGLWRGDRRARNATVVIFGVAGVLLIFLGIVGGRDVIDAQALAWYERIGFHPLVALFGGGLVFLLAAFALAFSVSIRAYFDYRSGTRPEATSQPLLGDIPQPTSNADVTPEVSGKPSHPPDDCCLACGAPMPEEVARCAACGWTFAGSDNANAAQQ
jgi:hypothetical protein